MFSRKDLMKLIIPLIIEQFLLVTVGLAGSMMVARVGEAAVSGVSLVDSINILLIGLFGAMATGGAVVSSQFLGRNEHKSACLAGEQLIMAVMSIAIILMVITLLFGKPMLTLLYGDVSDDVMAYAQIYFFISAISYPFIALYTACAALFRSMGNSTVSMLVSLFMNIINIVLNAVLIFGLNLGVEGSALATLISRIFAAVVILILLKNKKHPIHIESLRKFRPDMIMINRILRIGVPNGLENSAFQIGKILVQGIIAGLGTTAITANAVAATVGNVGILPGMAISMALIPVVGRCMGACDYDAVKHYTRRLMKIAYVAMFIVNLLLAISLPLILKVYDLSAETARISSQLLLYHCLLATLIWPLSFSLPNALRATNDVKFTMWISMISMWVWRIAFSYVLAITLHMGVLGIWIAMTIDWSFRSVFFAVRFRQARYRNVVMK